MNNPAAGSPASVVICALADRRYAIPVADLVEISALVRITPLPAAPPAVLGVINRHGRVIPLLDLRQCLGMTGAVLGLETLFVVVRGGPEQPDAAAGLVVDSVERVATLPPGAITLPAQSGPYIQGMAATQGDSPLLVLDVPALLDAFSPSVLSLERTA
ncbi:MAG: chemotaxis protein CheW [Anaerolineae bacterium]|nr:chemotaxis protein CheW [Anaerolineae bacterium]